MPGGVESVLSQFMAAPLFPHWRRKRATVYKNCSENGCTQHSNSLTRGQHLLDLVVSDLGRSEVGKKYHQLLFM